MRREYIYSEIYYIPEQGLVDMRRIYSELYYIPEQGMVDMRKEYIYSEMQRNPRTQQSEMLENFCAHTVLDL